MPESPESVAPESSFSFTPARAGRLIGLVGRAGSGKDTVAEIAGATRVAFAEPLKRFCGEVFGFSSEQLYGPSQERSRPDSRWTRPNGEALTARYALQTLGTEWGRNCDPDIWAKAGVLKAQRILAEGHRLVMITDCRFINEARIIREAGGELWRIYRPGTELAGAAGAHPSELEMDSPEMEALVNVKLNNAGTLEGLRGLVIGMLTR